MSSEAHSVCPYSPATRSLWKPVVGPRCDRLAAVTVYLILLSAAVISFVPMALMIMLERKENGEEERRGDREENRKSR